MQIDPLNAILANLIPDLANVYLGLLSIMIGSFVVYGKHWGKTRWNPQYQTPTKLFAWLVSSFITAYVLTRFASPLVQVWLSNNANYLVGITAAFVGALYLWFFRSGGWSLAKKLRWVPLVVCYGVTVLNVLAYHPEGSPVSSSETQLGITVAGLIFLAFLFSRSSKRRDDERF